MFGQLKYQPKGLNTVLPNLIPYIANRSRWKSFADGQGITNSLENFRGLLTPVNLKETRI